MAYSIYSTCIVKKVLVLIITRFIEPSFYRAYIECLPIIAHCESTLEVYLWATHAVLNKEECLTSCPGVMFIIPFTKIITGTVTMQTTLISLCFA